jgi:hypothetical protein
MPAREDFPPEEALYEPEIYQRISVFALLKRNIWEKSRGIMMPAMLKYRNKILLWRNRREGG